MDDTRHEPRAADLFSTAADGTITRILDESGLDPLVLKLARKVNKDAHDAGFKLVGRHVVAIGGGHEGRWMKSRRDEGRDRAGDREPPAGGAAANRSRPS